MCVCSVFVKHNFYSVVVVRATSMLQFIMLSLFVTLLLHILAVFVHTIRCLVVAGPFPCKAIRNIAWKATET